jgi:zinc protease
VLQPTTFKQDEILLRAFSPGGTSLASDQDFIPAETAGQIVAEGGLGPLSAIDLSKKLAGKVAFVRPEIGEMYEGLSGRALRRDLETMFQLIYLRFTQPRADAEAFRATTGNSRRAWRIEAQPDAVFEDTLNAAVTQNHFRARPMGPEFVAQMNLDKSLAFYGSLRGCERLHLSSWLAASIADDRRSSRSISAACPLCIARRPAATSASALRPVSSRGDQEGKHAEERGRRRVTGPFQNNERNRIIVRACRTPWAATCRGVARRLAAPTASA